MTYTYVLMEVSPAVYEEVKNKLLAAGYDHAIHTDRFTEDEVLDMHGIALQVQADAKNRLRTRAGKLNMNLDRLPGGKGNCAGCEVATMYCCPFCKVYRGQIVWLCEHPACREKHEAAGCARTQ